MTTYRVIFCDIDGTLLDSSHRLPDATALAVANVVSAGTPFVMVSARMPDAMYTIQDRLGAKAPMVCYGGALVLDRYRHPVHSIGIVPATAIAIKHRIAASFPALASCVYSFGQWIVDDAEDPRIAREVDIVEVDPVEGDVEAVLTPGNEVHKLFCVGDAADIDRAEQELKDAYPELAIYKSSPIYLEIMHRAVSKASSVEFICRAMRIPVAESVAFGDNYNDADMLAVAGLGVAMGNAPDEVKAKADKIAPDNDHEGVRAVLEEIDFLPMSHSIRYNRRPE